MKATGAGLAVTAALTVLLAGCGGSEQDATSRSCVVAEEDMADMLEAGDVIAAPQKNGYECL